MNDRLADQIKSAQYLSDEYLDKKKVVDVNFTDPVTAVLTFEDGTTQKVIGAFAVRIKTICHV